MYYCEGYGFYVTRDNATQQAERWLPLTFDHDDLNYSSYVTNAGSARTLRCQRPDQQWPQMLLPDIYQAPPVTAHQAYGGLKGDLAILLALVAFSMSREHLPQYLQSMFLGETWQVHGLPHGRTLALALLNGHADISRNSQARGCCLGLHMSDTDAELYI
jgi:hypothetical protein